MLYWTLWPLLILPLAAEPPALPDMTTAATPLFLNQCEKHKEASVNSYRCAGLVGTDVFVRETAGHYAVAIGTPTGAFRSFEAAHQLGQTMEWRIDGSRPVAGIVRYRFPAAETGPAVDVLAIIKAGTRIAGGCIVAFVDTSANAAASELARRTADERADAFECGRDTPGPAGRVSERVRSGILPGLR